MPAKNMRTTSDKRIERLVATRETPFLVIDREVVRRKYAEFSGVAGGDRLIYAVKANPHRRIIELLWELGADFEVSSERELGFLLGTGVPPHRIISSNPVKSLPFLKLAHSAGVAEFSFKWDSRINSSSIDLLLALVLAG